MKNLFLLLAVVGALSGQCVSAVQAQPGDQEWSTPIGLSDIPWPARMPVVTADPGGGVHVFWTEAVLEGAAGNGDTIFYTHWDGTSWSKPTDILLSPQPGPADYVRATSDTKGVLHVLWRGSGGIYYSQAHASGAGSAKAWTPAVTLPADASRLYACDIAADERGTLHVPCVNKIDDLENLYYMNSVDGGQTWSDQIHITNNSTDEPVSFGEPRVMVDGNGNIHVVWMQYPAGQYQPSLGSFYARSSDGGRTWTEPFEVTAGNYGWITVAAIGPDKIHLVWAGGAGPTSGRYHRYSTDGGQTWTSATRIFEGTFNGWSDMVVDSVGVLHMIWAPNAVFHSYWDGQRWAEPELVVAGILKQDPAIGYREIGYASMAISEGNKLLVAYPDGNQVWFTSSRTSAPYVPPKPLPTPSPAPTVTPLVSLTPTPTPTPIRQPTVTISSSSASSSASGQSSNPSIPVLAGVLPALLIVVAAVLVRSMRMGRG